MSAARIPGLIGWLAICFVAAALGAVASAQAPAFYAQLVQPEWAPPAYVFGPVWTVLYALMAIAAWLVWQSGPSSRTRTGLGFFLVQLALNTLWSWLFFAWHRGGLAFFDILALWALILITLLLFWRIRPLAGALLLPYLAWVSFAAVLNFAMWQLNPERLS